MRHDKILHGSFLQTEGGISYESRRLCGCPMGHKGHASFIVPAVVPHIVLNLANVGSLCTLLCLQGSAESDAAIGAVRKNTSWLPHNLLPDNLLPRDHVIQPAGNSCLLPFKELQARVGTLDCTLVSEDR